MICSCSLPNSVCVKELRFDHTNSDIPYSAKFPNAHHTVAFYRTRELNLSGKPSIVAVYSIYYDEHPTSQDQQQTIKEDRIYIKLKTTLKTTGYPLPISYFVLRAQTETIESAQTRDDFVFAHDKDNGSLSIFFKNHIPQW